MPLRLVITLIITAAIGLIMGLETSKSDPVVVQLLGTLLLLGMLSIPFVAISSVAAWAIWNRWKHRGRPLIHREAETNSSQKSPLRHRAWKALCLLVVIVGAWILGTKLTHPSHIRYDFNYGASESWHEVQIHHLEKGQWIEGPWVGRFPLEVSFPDLNKDGHEDIEVTGHFGHVTFLYLPENDGKKYWQIQENNGYAVSYAPGGYIWP